MKMFMKQSKKGFTLIEMIVVIVIVAILVALAVPSVLGYVRDAKDTQFMSQARLVYQKVNELALEEIAKNGVIENDGTSTGKKLNIEASNYYYNNVLEVNGYKSHPVHMLIYYDNMKSPYRFDASSDMHAVSKIGIAFTKFTGNKKDTVLVVILQNGEVKVFHDDPYDKTGETNDVNSKWYIEWEKGVGG